MSGLDYRIDEWTRDDWRYVASTWLRSFRSSSGSRLNMRDFARNHQPAIANAMRDCDTVRVARIGDTAIGWACISRDGELNYVFVRHQFRGCGVGRALTNGVRYHSRWTTAVAAAPRRPRRLDLEKRGE